MYVHVSVYNLLLLLLIHAHIIRVDGTVRPLDAERTRPTP